MSDDLPIGRFARTLTLIVFVTAAFLLLAATRLEGTLFRVGAVAVGAIAVVTAIVGFLISAANTYEQQTI